MFVWGDMRNIMHVLHYYENNGMIKLYVAVADYRIDIEMNLDNMYLCTDWNMK